MFNVGSINIFQFSREKTKSRISEIDFLRGVCILLMVLDHFFYQFGYLVEYIFGEISATSPVYMLHIFSQWWRNWDVRINVRYIVLTLFFFLSGICTTFSRDNLKRGLLTFFVALIINIFMLAIDHIAVSGMKVLFGAINCFAICILLYALYEIFLNAIKFKEPYRMRLTFIIGLIGTIIGFCATSFFDRALITLTDTVKVDNVSITTYVNLDKYILMVLGFYSYRGTGDYMPLLPYLGIFFLGASFATILYKNKKSLLKPLNKYALKLPKLEYYINSIKIPDNSLSTISSIEVVKVYTLFILNWIMYIPYKLCAYIVKVVRYAGKHSLIIYILHQLIVLIVVVIIMYALGYTLQF